MACIIGMVSQKGGAGKSTLARLFARERARDGFHVRIADLDTQQTTCAEWAADRAEAEIQAQAFGRLVTALREANRYDVYILDGRPQSSEQTVEIARAADLVVIPTGQTTDDLKPAVKLAHTLTDAGTPPERLAFALVRTTGSAAEREAVRADLGATDYAVLDGFLPVSAAYGIAHDRGKSVTETTHRSLNLKAEALAIVDRLGAVPRRTREAA
ncbi:hypothetical protein DXV76_04750 [Rhodobacteraceae bacterium CCMM004]|nr:hypothetical protein DXV76_04750 [Rhodobacteraceae bacterium CCMM004]